MSAPHAVFGPLSLAPAAPLASELSSYTPQEQPATVNKSKNERQDGQRRRRESGQRDNRRRSNEPRREKPKETTADKSDVEEKVVKSE